jgi:hypothetical protein
MTAQVAAVKFTVIVPGYSNQRNMTVYLAGSFNGWSAHDSLYIMNKETENSYSLTVPLFEGKNYNYKYTLGNWNAVETKLNDSNIANRKLYSKNGLSLYDTVLKWKDSPKATTPSPQMQKLAAVKDSAAKQLKLVLNDLLVLLKEYNQNMLSQKPNERLHKKQKKQTVEIFAKLYNTIEAKIWEIGTSLSTEQKQKILAAIKNSGESKDVINTIADAYSSVLK